ncbi:MAG: extracellular solute-binding protein [Trueperaceae bacterium]|nr:extracellular solute-binding protein [Trueperaceae bacterium]
MNWFDKKEKLSRRQLLKLVGAAGASAYLLPLVEQAYAQGISIPDSGATLPSDNVTLRWVDSGDQKAVFFNEFFAAYQAAHPNIKVAYDPLPWNEIAQVVPLGIRNGTAHDVFQLPLSVSGAQAVSEGWVQPLDDFIPNFAEWKAKFPPGIFLPGITDFEGKTYSFPFTSNKRYGTHLLYNKAIMEQAGYDPENEPLTWSSFREAAKKITEQGNGAYYGFIMGGNQINRWADVVRGFGQMAGAVGGTGAQITADMNFLTGEYSYNTEEYIAAVELLLQLRDDGSVFPGMLSINAPQARAFMPQGAAGMILQGPWNIPQWERDNPEFDFGISTQPLPDDGDVWPLAISEGGANGLWIFKDSPNAAVAGDIFHYLGTLEGQTQWANIVGAADPPVMPESIANATLSPRAAQALNMFNEQVKVGPNPVVRNPDIVQVTLEMRTPEPSFAQVIQGLYTGQLSDVKAQMQDVQDRYTAELERAIAAANEKGADVSRDDWVFSNWDPRSDYGAEKYDEL